MLYYFCMYAIAKRQYPTGTWFFKVHFQRAGKLYQHRFSETTHGSLAKALKAAVTWRDGQLASAQTLSVKAFCAFKRSNNSSGVAGVHFLKSLKQPQGLWQAKLKIGGGKYKSKNFSVLLHGNHAAYEMAVAARLEMLSHAKDAPYVYDEVAKRLAPKPKR